MSMDRKDTEPKIQTILVKQFKKRGLRHQIKHTDSLIGAGILDSLSAIELVSELEKEFKIVISQEEMSENNFDSIEKITHFIRNKLSNT